MKLVVRDVVLNRMHCSCSDNSPAFALHKKGRIARNCILDLAGLTPKLRRVEEHPPPGLLNGGFLNHYPVILRGQPIRPAQMLNNKPERFFSSNHGQLDLFRITAR